MVTAEAALVLPLVAVFALVLVWLVSVCIAQVRIVDAARDGARAVARGDDDATVEETARRTAGGGAVVGIRHDSHGLVTVTVTRSASAPDWLLVPLPDITVRSAATVDGEDDGAAS